MPRRITRPAGSGLLSGTQPTNRGGTGADNATHALLNLGGVFASALGQPNGIMALDANGQTPQNSFNTVGIDGETVAVVGITNEWFITTYDAMSNYQVSAIGGVVSRLENVISYRPDGTVRPGGFIINGRRITIEVVDSNAVGGTINRPTITAPVSGSINIAKNATLVNSAFSMLTGTDTHYATDWEISTEPDFDTTVAAIYNSREHLRTWIPEGLEYNTQYYARVRQLGVVSAKSAWSPVISFTTKTNPLPTTEVMRAVGTSTHQFPRPVFVSDDGDLVITQSIEGGTLKLLCRAKIDGAWAVAQTLTVTAFEGSAFAETACSRNADFIAVSRRAYYEHQYGGVEIYRRVGNSWVSMQTIRFNGNQKGDQMLLSDNGLTLVVACSGIVATDRMMWVYTRDNEESLFGEEPEEVYNDLDTRPVLINITGDGRRFLTTQFVPNGQSTAVRVWKKTSTGYTSSQSIAFAAYKHKSSEQGDILVGVDDSYGIKTYVYNGSTYIYEGVLAKPIGLAWPSDIFWSLSRDGRVLAIPNDNSHSLRIYHRSGNGWVVYSNLFASNPTNNITTANEQSAKLSANGEKVAYMNSAADTYGVNYLFA